MASISAQDPTFSSAVAQVAYRQLGNWLLNPFAPLVMAGPVTINYPQASGLADAGLTINTLSDYQLVLNSTSGTYSSLYFTHLGTQGAAIFFDNTNSRLIIEGPNVTNSIVMNSTVAWTIAAAHGITINAPTAAQSLNINAASGQYGLVINGAASSYAALSLVAGGQTFGTNDAFMFQYTDFSLRIGNRSTLPATANVIIQVGAGNCLQLDNTNRAINGWGVTAAGMVDMSPDSGTFTITFSTTYFTVAQTGTCVWAKIGSLVTIAFPAISGTSQTTTGTSFIGTGIPAVIQPTRAQNFKVPFNTDNGVNGDGGCQITAAGALNLYKGTNQTLTSWTASGTKAVAAFSVTYLLN